MTIEEKTKRKIRYAVVGAGHIAQSAVLPAFRNARNSELVALVSGDDEKRDALRDEYDLEHAVGYDGYDELLASGAVDAVYIALPNHQHEEYTVRAARHRVHVLCEKPMAVNEQQCRNMIEACDQNGVRLMIAYRLHFEETNLTAMELVRSGTIGEPRYFNSVFSFDVQPGDIRLAPTSKGGGPLYDIGTYCVNAVRHLFRDEPLDVFAQAMTGNDPRFDETQEMVAVTMRFPEYRLASFIVGFGADHLASYRVAGTKGSILVEPAYSHSSDLHLELTLDGEVKEEKTYKRRDQFGPELIYFSECITQGTEPEPGGNEGLADVRIIEAALRSIATARVVKLGDFPPVERPSAEQELKKPPVKAPELVGVEPPHD